MHRYKIVENNHIIGVTVGCDCGGIKISRSEYKKILSLLSSAPEVGEGQSAFLRNDTLTWEIYEEPKDEEK